MSQAIVYLVGNAIVALLQASMVPILIRALSREAYGQLGVFLSCAAFFSTAIGLSSQAVVGIAIVKEGVVEGSATFDDSVLLSVLSSAAFAVVGLAALAIGVDPSWTGIVLVAVLYSLFTNLSLGVSLLFNRSNNARMFVLLQVVPVALAFVLTLGALRARPGVSARIGALLAASIVTFAMAYLIARRHFPIGPRVRPAAIWALARRSRFFLFNALGVFLVSSADRLIVASQLPLSAAGVWTANVQFVLMLGMFYDAMNKAYVPALYRHLKSPSTARASALLCNPGAAALVAVGAGAAIGVAGYLALPLIFPSAFRLRTEIYVLLCGVQIMGGCYLVYVNYLFYEERGDLIAYNTFAAGLLNSVLLVFLTRAYGLLGAAMAQFASMAFRLAGGVALSTLYGVRGEPAAQGEQCA